MADSEDQNTAPAPAADAPASTEPNGDGASGGDQTPNQNNDQNPDGDGESGSQDGNQADGDSAADGDDTDDVATRRHNRTHAATRVATKQAAQQSQDEGDAPQGKNDGQGDAPNELEQVKAELADLRSREEAREDEAEINQIVAENEHFKPFVDRVKKLAADPSRKQVPIKSLFYEAAGDNLFKLGAQQAATANADAAENSQQGTSTGNAPDGVSVKDMSTEDFQKMQEDVRNKL